MRAEDNDLNQKQTLYRSRRIYYAGNGWYLATREGEQGPFPSKRVALLAMKNFLRSLPHKTRRTGS